MTMVRHNHATVDKRVVEALREMGGTAASLGALRSATRLGSRQVSDSIARLRRKGVTEPDWLTLTPGMMRPDTAAPSLAEAVAAEAVDAAERRRIARATGHKRALPYSAAEQVATALVETPGDLVATVQRRWPDIWDRVVMQARAVGAMPGALLVECIERGLESPLEKGVRG